MDPLLLGVGLLFLTAIALVVRARTGTRSGGGGGDHTWTRGDVDAYLEDADLYDVEQLEELGAYDVFLDLAAAGEISDERAFERLCDAVVSAGGDWESAVENFAEGDLDDISRSWKAHNEARERAPPISLGDEIELGVLELETHHSGELRAMGKVEGFVVFVHDVPDSLSEGDIVRAKAMYFNRGKTSASATFLEVIG